MKSVPPTESKPPTEVTTPETNPTYDVGISEHAKARVDPNDGRCMVTNTEYALEFCHCIERRRMQNLEDLHRLEWYWNMRHSSLNLDTRYNIFRLDSSYHTHFDIDGWLLLPHPDILNKFRSSVNSIQVAGRVSAVREHFPKFDEDEIFSYKFVLLKGWEKQFILRLNDTESESSDLPYVCHKYPFTSLPYVKSHIRPQFAIFNAGAKLMRALEKQKDLIESSPDILFVMNLYEAWTRDPPPNCKQDKSYYPPSSSHDHTDDSDDDFVDDEDPDFDDQASDRKRKRKAAQPVSRKKPKQKQEQKA